MKQSMSKHSTLLVLLAGTVFGLAQTQTTPQTQSPSQPQTSSQPQSPSQTQAPSQGQTSSGGNGLQVNPSGVQQKASMAPPSTATKTNTIGQKVTATTPASSDSWAEQIDADGSGAARQTNLVWDGADKVLYSNTSGTFTCRNGATGSGELLVAVNAQGNKWGRPAGSGFWLASMDKGACGVQANSFWGCRFDPSGNPTVCGTATLDQTNNDLIIVTAQK